MSKPNHNYNPHQPNNRWDVKINKPPKNIVLFKVQWYAESFSFRLDIVIHHDLVIH